MQSPRRGEAILRAIGFKSEQTGRDKERCRGTLFAYYTTVIRREEATMPERKTIERAREDKREGKAPSTQAGEFVREEMEHIREGKHGARSTKQAIAIGLSKARRAGVDLPPPAKGKTKSSTRKSAKYAYEAGQGRRKPHRRARNIFGQPDAPLRDKRQQFPLSLRCIPGIAIDRRLDCVVRVNGRF